MAASKIQNSLAANISHARERRPNPGFVVKVDVIGEYEGLGMARKSYCPMASLAIVKCLFSLEAIRRGHGESIRLEGRLPWPAAFNIGEHWDQSAVPRPGCHP